MCTHQADASDTALGDGALAHLRRLLPEKEIQLIVVPLCAVGDEVHVDERGVCGVREGSREDDERFIGFTLKQRARNMIQRGDLGTVTVQPSGVVLVCPHGRLAPQRAEHGGVGSHEVHVDAGIQLTV